MSADQAEWEGYTMPVSVCAICDKDRDPLDVPDEPCGHSMDQRRTVGVPMVPASELSSARSRVEELEEALAELERELEDRRLAPGRTLKPHEYPPTRSDAHQRARAVLSGSEPQEGR